MQQGEDERGFRARLEQADQAAVPAGPGKEMRIKFLGFRQLIEGRLALEIADGLRVGQDKVLLVDHRELDREMRDVLVRRDYSAEMQFAYVFTRRGLRKRRRIMMVCRC